MKKIYSLALVSLTAAILVGCGNSDTKKGETQKSSTNAELNSKISTIIKNPNVQAQTLTPHGTAVLPAGVSLMNINGAICNVEVDANKQPVKIINCDKNIPNTPENLKAAKTIASTPAPEAKK